MPTTKTITETTYDNGAQEVAVNGLVTFIRYSNGDQVYFDEAGKVWSIETYNGLSFTYHYPAWFNLTPRVAKH